MNLKKPERLIIRNVESVYVSSTSFIFCGRWLNGPLLGNSSKHSKDQASVEEAGRMNERDTTKHRRGRNPSATYVPCSARP